MIMFVRVTKHDFNSIRLAIWEQPNMTVWHALSLSLGGLALLDTPDLANTQTKHDLNNLFFKNYVFNLQFTLKFPCDFTYETISMLAIF